MDARLQPILYDIASKASINNPLVVCTYETGKGEGYMGIVKMFDISEQCDNNLNNKKLSIIVKLSPLSDYLHAKLPVRRLFLTEIRFYTKIAKALNEFQLEHNVKCYQFVNCLYSESTIARKEMLIIENLKPIGYDVINRNIPMKHDHMKLVFEELAKLNAVSYALKHKKPQVYQEVSEQLFDNILLQLYNQMGFDNFINKISSNCKKLFEGTDIYEIYCEFVERIVDEFHKSNIPDEYAIISHGDTWCNNILFKHDTNGTPLSAILIDFQMCKLHSPVLDLSYFFYGCADVELLPKLNYFLKIYHDTLKKSLVMFGLDVEQVYPWSKLLEHWKIYSKFGFITSFLMRVIMLSTADESPDLSETAKKEVDVVMAFLYKMKHENEYNDAIKAIVRHYIEEKYIY